MPITLRLFSAPALGTGLRYAVFSGRVNIGIIEERKQAPNEGCWEWALHALPVSKTPLQTTGMRDTLEEAKDAFRKAWEAWLAMAGLQERDI